MFQTAISALVMLLVTVGPPESATIFASLTANEAPAVRRKIAARAVLIAGVVLLLFAFGGSPLLRMLGIGLPAFRLAGGFLLLLVSVDLMFAHPSGLTSITQAEADEAERRDIAVFPLAIPLIAGPGSMAASVLLVGQAPDAASLISVTAALLVVLGITFVCLLLATRITRILGLTGANVFSRVSGMLLAALAMQLIIDGLQQSAIFGPLRHTG
jgi:multiple antibiotic resistance protein